MKIYKEETRVKSYDVDKNGKLSAVQVFNFLQEAAFRHSVLDRFGQPDLAELGMIWVLSRMKVILVEDVQLGESIEITSWVRAIKGALSERDYLLIRDGKVVVKATSLWACLSISTVKPSAIPNQIANKMAIHHTEENTKTASKIKAIDNAESSSIYNVRQSDIDMVNHTNNVAYVRMVLDQFDSIEKIKQIEINYLLQSFQGDKLMIQTQKQDNRTHICEITNTAKDVVCRLRVHCD